MWSRAVGIVVALAFTVLPFRVGGQQVRQLAPGDSIRFTFLERIQWQGANGRVDSTTVRRQSLRGGFVGMDDDSVQVRLEGVARAIAAGDMEDVQVWEAHRDRKKWAIVGGVIGGIAGFAYARCNPAWVGEGGCMGPSEGHNVVEATIGAAVVFGIAGALGAPDHRWRSVAITPTGVARSGAFTAVLSIPFPGPGAQGGGSY